MQKKFLKIGLIVFITILFLFTINAIATEDSSSPENAVDSNDVISEENLVENNSELNNEENQDIEEPNEQENVDNEDSDDEDVGSTGGSKESTPSSSTYVPPQTTQPKNSYSTIATIPEANLSLNNILNVILIAVGAILILLAIAILIRLK